MISLPYELISYIVKNTDLPSKSELKLVNPLLYALAIECIFKDKSAAHCQKRLLQAWAKNPSHANAHLIRGCCHNQNWGFIFRILSQLAIREGVTSQPEVPQVHPQWGIQPRTEIVLIPFLPVMTADQISAIFNNACEQVFVFQYFAEEIFKEIVPFLANTDLQFILEKLCLITKEEMLFHWHDYVTIISFLIPKLSKNQVSLLLQAFFPLFYKKSWPFIPIAKALLPALTESEINSLYNYIIIAIIIGEELNFYLELLKVILPKLSKDQRLIVSSKLDQKYKLSTYAFDLLFLLVPRENLPVEQAVEFKKMLHTSLAFFSAEPCEWTNYARAFEIIKRFYKYFYEEEIGIFLINITLVFDKLNAEELSNTLEILPSLIPKISDDLLGDVYTLLCSLAKSSLHRQKALHCLTSLASRLPKAQLLARIDLHKDFVGAIFEMEALKGQLLNDDVANYFDFVIQQIIHFPEEALKHLSVMSDFLSRKQTHSALEMCLNFLHVPKKKSSICNAALDFLNMKANQLSKPQLDRSVKLATTSPNKKTYIKLTEFLIKVITLDILTFKQISFLITNGTKFPLVPLAASHALKFARRD